MTELRSVAVLGLGLIGGSLARDLARRGVRVLGYDANPETVDAALGEGAIHAAVTAALHELTEADVVVLAVPVDAAPALLARARPHVGAARLITDVGSTKRTIAARAEALGLGERFVGAHPMAGDHRSGWRASRRGLFAGARVYLCPLASAGAEARAVAHALWSAVGATPVSIDPAIHDQRVAVASHLPQLLSTVLARVLAGAGVGRSDLGPAGHDLTRLAGSSPEVWTAIVVDNADAIAAALRATLDELRALSAAVEERDARAVARFLGEGREWFARNPEGNMPGTST